MPIPDTIVQLTVTAQTLGVSQAGFGVAMILADPTTTLKPGNTFGTNLTKLYTSAEEVLTDFAVTDKEYLAANILKSQNPSPSTFRIGLRSTPVATVIDLVFGGAIIIDNQIQVRVNGNDLLQDFDTSDANTLTELALKIAAVEGIASAVSGANKVTITATVDFGLTVENAVVVGGASQVSATPTVITPGSSVAEDIAAIRNEKDDWYDIISAKVSDSITDTMARTVEGLKKRFNYADADATIKAGDVSSMPGKLQAKSLRRSLGFYHESPESEFINAGLLGRTLPIAPGAGIAKFRTLSNVTISDLNESEVNNILGLNANCYMEVGGRNIVRDGRMANGDWFDTVRDLDYTEAKLAEAVFSVLVNLEKVPFTQKGIDLMVGTIEADLERRVDEGVLAPGTVVVTAPAVDDVPTNDKANRILPDVKFTAKLAGAIQKVIIDGTVSV